MSIPFPRTAVRLLDGPMRDRQTRNGEYLLAIGADRLLHNFRTNAGLASAAEPLGGWESPRCGLRGHFTGHALTGLAQHVAGTGDPRFKSMLDTLVDGLDECQRALGDGYLAAFPSTEFDTLERTFGGVWAPYYTLHKILAGLIAAATDGQNARATAIACRLGDWIVTRMARLAPETIERMLRTDQFNPANEYGGIGEALYDLSELAGDPRYRRTAKLFDREWFLAPLAAGEDRLAGLHANTHIPQGLAAARRYELEGDVRALVRQRRIVRAAARSRRTQRGGRALARGRLDARHADAEDQRELRHPQHDPPDRRDRPMER
jgi:uncharacterized protein